jgi:hypothetical protein
MAIDNRLRWGIKPEWVESPQYGAILRQLEPIGSIGRI